MSAWPRGDGFATQDRAQELAEPGYYATRLLEPAVKAELTASLRGAAHRYTFEAPAEGAGDSQGAVHVAIDAASSVRDDDGAQAIALRWDEEAGLLLGSVRYQGAYVGRQRPFTLHFAAAIAPRPDEVKLWGEEEIPQQGLIELPEGTERRGGALLSWDAAPSDPVELRFGLSMVDASGALAHLEQEVSLEHDFGSIRERARAAWLERLGTIRVAGGTLKERILFYTALYNAFRMPTRFDDHDGRYPGLDGLIHQADHAYYTDLSLWDSFRTTHPLYDAIAPDVQRDVLKSLLAMARDGGTVPRWPAATSYTGGMIGTSADLLFGGSASKNLSGIDWASALSTLLLTADGKAPEGAAFQGREGIQSYIERGYVASDQHSGSASMTLEYAYNDWGVAAVARAAGEQEVAERMTQRSRSYKAIFDAERGFFRARQTDGSWRDGFKPEAVEGRHGDHFVEGSAWHYRFYAMQDLEGLVELHGGPGEFGERLEALFENSTFGVGVLKVKHILPEPYYWHGNQPSLHNVSLFALSDRPERQAYWLERIREEYYDVTPAGLAGNDDGGTLSSWYVWHALGLYPIAGSAQYLLGSPVFTRAEVRSSGGEQWSMRANGSAPWRREIGEVSLGDAPLTAPRVAHEALQGETLDFEILSER